MASSRRNRNALCSIEVNGALKEYPDEIRIEVLNHFQRQFAESWFNKPSLSGPFKSIGDEEVRVALEAEFTESEVVVALNNCDGNKAPKPNGFNLMMFQKPISLIGSLYKVLSKVLSSRLKVVLPKIINESQSAFIGGRRILDGILVANEIVYGWKKKQKKGLILKLDFEKAYDSINWEFLCFMLSNFGFGSKWIIWMKKCTSTAKVSIMVNGSPTAEFNPQRGLRQDQDANSRVSIVWRGILGVAVKCPELLEFFKANSKIIIGDGRLTKFWLDLWVGNDCLKNLFPRLFSMSIDKGESMALVKSRSNGNEECDLAFRRVLFQWELEELRRLKELLHTAPDLRNGVLDGLNWAADKSGVFTVASVYKWSELPSTLPAKLRDLI
ncbi:uncharacterized protein LOC114271723 [Camellia sinensis]|uniref:uncharacterized protein LOC114271723 n=1 Tax=Camellia sinensis TaxID=4442 RepID=UPI0010368F58|nr:uncharacterized protein LOC114271723 [Camellia sinensis]